MNSLKYHVLTTEELRTDVSRDNQQEEVRSCFFYVIAKNPWQNISIFILTFLPSVIFICAIYQTAHAQLVTKLYRITKDGSRLPAPARLDVMGIDGVRSVNDKSFVEIISV